MSMQTEVVVIGSGPGGYTAAFRAADLGKKVVMIERYDAVGGVCLNVGCIPSKALLHAAKVVDEAAEMSEHGIQFGKPKIDTKKLVEWKNNVVTKLTGGVKTLAKVRKVEIVTGVAKFISDHELEVTKKDGSKETVQFQQAVIAVGSRPVKLPFLPDDPRIIDSTGALKLEEVNGKMLVIGGGIIGLEMATVYHTLGTHITVVELMDQIIPGADNDIVMPLYKRIKGRYENIYLKSKVTQVEAKKDGLYVTFEGEEAPQKPEKFDRILCAVGRRPNGDQIDAAKAGIKVDERGFIPVDKQMRTNIPHIYAIGDVTGNPMLAHKAMPEGRIAAEVIAGLKHYFDAKCIASVAYTDPEIAWVGVTETEAKSKGIKYGKGVFPWAASGRSLSLGRSEGLTKLLIDETTHRVIGAGIVGPNAGELIAEVALAIEMGCDVADVALTIHPHPTLSETVALAAEVFEGTITDLYMPKKKVEKVSS
ncbi:MAG: dihydrolipoyl dehydrogenase [Gammaproteobacteria bacterium]|nr:dihydrolipoyl dehydrogenase [Gammaproteobacteria bacterium]MCW5582300.1 dihydrolipoyl dehydrogenase [Gammaproteobacteria bacterium]